MGRYEIIKIDEEIQQEIGKLEELLPVIQPYSAFGGDNKAQISAQLEVLRHK